MLVEVPAPPWMKSVTNWSFMSPAITLSHARMIAPAIVASRVRGAVTAPAGWQLRRVHVERLARHGGQAV
jgi:hypothetical protein